MFLLKWIIVWKDDVFLPPKARVDQAGEQPLCGILKQHVDPPVQPGGGTRNTQRLDRSSGGCGQQEPGLNVPKDELESRREQNPRSHWLLWFLSFQSKRLPKNASQWKKKEFKLVMCRINEYKLQNAPSITFARNGVRPGTRVVGSGGLYCKAQGMRLAGPPFMDKQWFSAKRRWDSVLQSAWSQVERLRAKG